MKYYANLDKITNSRELFLTNIWSVSLKPNQLRACHRMVCSWQQILWFRALVQWMRIMCLKIKYVSQVMEYTLTPVCIKRMRRPKRDNQLDYMSKENTKNTIEDKTLATLKDHINQGQLLVNYIIIIITVIYHLMIKNLLLDALIMNNIVV